MWIWRDKFSWNWIFVYFFSLCADNHSQFSLLMLKLNHLFQFNLLHLSNCDEEVEAHWVNFQFVIDSTYFFSRVESEKFLHSALAWILHHYLLFFHVSFITLFTWDSSACLERLTRHLLNRVIFALLSSLESRQAATTYIHNHFTMKHIVLMKMESCCSSRLSTFSTSSLHPHSHDETASTHFPHDEKRRWMEYWFQGAASNSVYYQPHARSIKIYGKSRLVDNSTRKPS